MLDIAATGWLVRALALLLQCRSCIHLRFILDIIGALVLVVSVLALQWMIGRV